MINLSYSVTTDKNAPELGKAVVINMVGVPAEKLDQLRSFLYSFVGAEVYEEGNSQVRSPQA